MKMKFLYLIPGEMELKPIEEIDGVKMLSRGWYPGGGIINDGLYYEIEVCNFELATQFKNNLKEVYNKKIIELGPFLPE